MVGDICYRSPAMVTTLSVRQKCLNRPVVAAQSGVLAHSPFLRQASTTPDRVPLAGGLSC